MPKNRKYVEYGGKLYSVPPWAKYIMHDSTGEIYAYETLPVKGQGTVWQSGGLWEKVGSVFPRDVDPLEI